jgi:hypothetical protein
LYPVRDSIHLPLSQEFGKIAFSRFYHSNQSNFGYQATRVAIYSLLVEGYKKRWRAKGESGGREKTGIMRLRAEEE